MLRARRRGFTLIELLVVLVIVAAMAGLLVLSMQDSPERALQREARGLAALLNTAADEAVLQARDLGLAIDDRGYRFVVFDPERNLWLPLRQAPLGEHRFEDGYTVEFALDGERIDAATRARIERFIARDAASEERSDRPALLLLSSGELTAFALTLRRASAAFVLRSDGFNAVTVAAAESGA